MTAHAPSVIGQPVSRVDGPEKVTGRARYAAEFDLADLAYGALVLSTVPAGRIAAIDASAAQARPGVLAVIHHGNAPRLPYNRMPERAQVDPKSGDQLRVFQDDVVHFAGQPVAVVVASTQEAADAAAALVQVTYAQEAAVSTFEAGRGREPTTQTQRGGRPGDASRGDADRAFAAAPVRVDAVYVQPREHHNAIEPHATIARWDGDRLTLFDKTQWPDNDRKEIAYIFGVPEEKIRVISPYVGGAFGSALRTWPHVTIAAVAAKAAGRPVRIELTRRELYVSIGFRPHTEQRVALGAERDGRLTAVIHEATGQTALYEEYAEVTLDPSRNLYSCPNVRSRYRLVEMNTNSPCPMRAPGTATGMLALETAMDELAVALGMDPVELRLRNYAERDEHKDLPWSSKELRACYAQAAERFGWSRRNPAPRSMRDGRQLVGYGMATAMYPAHRSKASARATVFANGTALVQAAGSDMGPGTYTSMTQVAADALGLPVEKVRFELGDTDLPFAPVHGGSITMASLGSAVQAACRALLDDMRRVCRAAPQPMDPDGPFEAVLGALNLDRIVGEADSAPGDEAQTYSSAAFGAVFVEVRVDEDLGSIRAPRIVGAYDVGRVVNPKTARSQCIGGMVQGLGMALLEKAEWDERFGRVMNANLAEYLVPVCADVAELDVTFVESEDAILSPLGVKGVAEIAICGVAAAILNAVHHATGLRVREVPVHPERLLGGVDASSV